MENLVRTCGLVLEGIKMCFKKTVLCWNVWYSWWHHFCLCKGELNLWKWAVHMILGRIDPESYDLVCMFHIRFRRLLFLFKTITDILYLNIPENSLITQGTVYREMRSSSKRAHNYISMPIWDFLDIKFPGRRRGQAVPFPRASHWNWCQ